MANRKPKLKYHNKEPAITISRTAYAASELVYIASANKVIRYEHGTSQIAYIGTTKNGIRRIAASAAWKAEDILARRGIHTLEFYLVASPRHGKHVTYRKLERVLLLRFRERYGSVPIANKQGIRLRWREEDRVFSEASINKLLDDFSR